MPSYDERVVSLIVFIFLSLGANLTGIWGPEKGPLGGPRSQLVGPSACQTQGFERGRCYVGR